MIKSELKKRYKKEQFKNIEIEKINDKIVNIIASSPMDSIKCRVHFLNIFTPPVFS